MLVIASMTQLYLYGDKSTHTYESVVTWCWGLLGVIRMSKEGTRAHMYESVVTYCCALLDVIRISEEKAKALRLSISSLIVRR